MTNLDRIKNMTANELAKLFDDIGHDCSKICSYFDTDMCHSENCKDGIKKWLEQEATE